MENQQNINLVRRLYDEVFSQNKIELCDTICDAKMKLHDAALPQNENGLAKFKEGEENYKRAFPDKKVHIDDIFSQGDKVIVRWTCKGTQTGKLQDIAPSNKKFTITGISIYLIKNNTIVEAWQSWDRLGLLEQIGELQPSHALH